ncbi:MAG: molybdopterin-synthase adenylyltransferase MoeB [Robiginitomaculum sp.]|nr:molybdopterin-synthase adenylyltransferase MoeB [Robiginitomaculum sp.]
MSPEEIERYKRQIILKEIGGIGQQALGQAKVLIIGAGGLGGPCGLYLAAAGIGTLGIVDDDNVDLSNLHRQIQFGSNDIDGLKTESMEHRLTQLNPNTTIMPHTLRLGENNAASLITGYDLIIDGCDNFPTRFAVNKACLHLSIPLISGALGRFDGQLASFPSDGKSACYQCFVPQIPDNIESCAAVGVLGPMAGIIGSMMALEAIKIITDAGEPLFGKLFLFDGLTSGARTITLPRDPSCPACFRK